MKIATLKRGLTRWLVVQRIGKKPSTRKYHREIIKQIRRAWRPALLKHVDEITADDVAQFAIAAGDYSATRWNAMMTVLHAAVPAARSLKRRKVEMKDKPVPTRRQFAKLLAECYRRPGSYAGIVVNFLAHTGMRITEAKALRWSDVHRRHIEVPGQLTKSGKPRTIPFVNGFAGVVEQLRAIADDSGYVLPRPGIRTALATACAKAGLPRQTHHDFRHMFTTRSIESSVDVPTAARWLGHQDKGALLAKRYFHLLDEHSRRMAKKVKI
jgi:integrase